MKACRDAERIRPNSGHAYVSEEERRNKTVVRAAAAEIFFTANPNNEKTLTPLFLLSTTS
jgi:hypothetical protein